MIVDRIDISEQKARESACAEFFRQTRPVCHTDGFDHCSVFGFDVAFDKSKTSQSEPTRREQENNEEKSSTSRRYSKLFCQFAMFHTFTEKIRHSSFTSYRICILMSDCIVHAMQKTNEQYGNFPRIHEKKYT